MTCYIIPNHGFSCSACFDNWQSCLCPSPRPNPPPKNCYSTLHSLECGFILGSPFGLGPIRLSSADAVLPMRCALDSAMESQSRRPLQGKGTSVPLLWGCTVAASVLEHWLGLGPLLTPTCCVATHESGLLPGDQLFRVVVCSSFWLRRG